MTEDKVVRDAWLQGVKLGCLAWRQNAYMRERETERQRWSEMNR